MAKKRLSRTSIFICALVAIVAVAAFVAWHFIGSASTSARAIIHDGDGGETELALSEDQTKTVTTSLGTNVVVVKDGEVYVSEADCPNHDCIKQGKISKNGQQIICLPHKLWVEVVTEDGEDATSSSDLDITSR